MHDRSTPYTIFPENLLLRGALGIVCLCVFMLLLLRIGRPPAGIIDDIAHPIGLTAFLAALVGLGTFLFLCARAQTAYWRLVVVAAVAAAGTVVTSHMVPWAPTELILGIWLFNGQVVWLCGCAVRRVFLQLTRDDRP